MNILLVDDEPVVSKIVARILRRLGHAVKEATSGHQGWEMIQEHPVDLLITDNDMPEMKGLELIARCKALIPELRVALISGRPVPEASSLGIFFKEKPLCVEDVEEILREAQ